MSAPRPAGRRARLVTGPAARGLAFAVDFVAALIRAARGTPGHPEERR